MEKRRLIRALIASQLIIAFVTLLVWGFSQLGPDPIDMSIPKFATIQMLQSVCLLGVGVFVAFIIHFVFPGEKHFKK